MVVEFCLMASSTYCPWSFEQGLLKSSKDSQAFLTSQPARKDVVNSDAFHLKVSYPRDSWDSRSSISNQFAMLNSVRDPVLVSMKDAHPNLMLLSFGIAEHCIKREKVLNFLMYGASESSEGLDLTVLGKVMGLHTLQCNGPQHSLDPSDDVHFLYEVDGVKFQPSILYPKAELNLHGSQFDFAYDLTNSTQAIPLCDGQVLLSGNRHEIRDLLSVAAEFQLSTSSTRPRSKSMVVPYFTRSKRRRALPDLKDASVENVMVAPLKCPSRMKPLPKKKSGGNIGTDRDMYRRNYFHACEVMLSLIVDKNKGKTAMISSLKRSGPELPLFLTQCSAGIAGAGLAVLMSVVCKVAGGRVPFCTSKMLNTGLGFGLVWLSSAVNKLRDAVVCASKKSNKLQLKDEEIMQKVDRSMSEIFFRSATLLAIFILRVA